ncbi:MAG: hypothetical protein FJW36_10305 [Acidobacteria bacterium]|nr:hypothetical protein [Acidobacteriota bacterium]
MRGIFKLLLGVAIFLAADAAAFRSGWYAPYLEPNSSAGMLQLTLSRARKHQSEWTEPLVLTLGDSRMNYSSKLANEHAAKNKYPFRLSHGGVAGTNPRVWHYILRELDPTARRYKAIVFPVDSFDDEDTFIDYNDYPIDINYLSLLLRWSDIPAYPQSYATPKYALEAWKASLFKGAALQQDILALFLNPAKRLEEARTTRDWWPNGSYDYLEEERSVAGLAIDWTTRAVTIPPGVDRQVIETVLLRPNAPQTGRYGQYRRRWFNELFARYQNSPTKLIFVMLPRGPIVRPPVQTVSSVIRDFAKQGRITLGDEHRFESLEKPELFRDGLHMNRAGSTLYGEMLTDDLQRILGAI